MQKSKEKQKDPQEMLSFPREVARMMGMWKKNAKENSPKIWSPAA